MLTFSSQDKKKSEIIKTSKTDQKGYYKELCLSKRELRPREMNYLTKDDLVIS
jgi:hypothetical protein